MKLIVDILRLEWLRGENASRNWKIISGVLIYMMLSIWLAHTNEQKAHRLYLLKKENRELRAEYVQVKRLLMRDGLRSNIYNKIKDRGYIIPKRRPKYLKEQ